MGVLERIKSPSDVRKLTTAQAIQLASELRTFLVQSVSQTGGHLGPNLGVVELTIALHQVFDSPRDTLVFDTGHQAYVHKILTGRNDFSSLRKQGGLSGYPSRAESEHDVVENSHASTSLSWADGIAQGYRLQGGSTRHVAAVIGDGALTGGMAWEALNNIAASKDLPLVIVVNDNGRSYAPTIGGLAHHLDTLRATRGYENVLDWGKKALNRSGPPGRLAYDALHGLKKGLRDVVMPSGMFEDLGLKYIGPIDGHDIVALARALRRAKDFGGPVLVHVMTEKGRGYTPAERDTADRFHGIGPIHPETGLPIAPSRFGWTSVFSDEIAQIARQREDVVAITAAMLRPVGLAEFAEQFPERVFDVGIAEQHAVTAAAGMAFAGLHPVIAMYATFLNRAFDQILLDAALHKAGITIVLDRAGVTGDDGPSHNGMWDMSLVGIVPGLRLAAPRDEPTLRSALRDAVKIHDGPTVVRYPKGPVGPLIPASEVRNGIDVLAEHGANSGTRVLVLGVGAMAALAVEVGSSLAAEDMLVTVVSPTWVLPVPAALVELAADADLVITIEDGLVVDGVGSRVLAESAVAGVTVPFLMRGIGQRFVEHASRAQVLAEERLTASDIVADAKRALNR
ncbi:1-deoxy-D-xylulose-5-phosphate synthase [Rarobacter incanus]|uniref:1-deoxy-D-xylulose-5-phosphate synthase n=1 Tax=Rarobacter incanus TaxID=153494 RepID=A0A542SLS0_9MICO|nr:1-deoxy-D-xylulose-5-phosphate synthase [Rarobacter incanus]TQK75579.1 1-deoxy-D-xylulose-5-phosphate synthase [Rarobacter incanus]